MAPSRSRTEGEAFCFEPDADSFKLCEINVYRNGCSAATCLPLAVGASTRDAIMFSSGDRPAQSSLYLKEETRTAATQTIKVVSFRDWLAEHPGDFDLLKCDCEGAEWELLESTPEVFRRFKVVVIEVHKNPISQRPIDGFKEVLCAQGFSMVRWDGHANGIFIGQRIAKPIPAAA